MPQRTQRRFVEGFAQRRMLVAAVTLAPARAIRRPSLGTLAVGTKGDATIVGIEHGAVEFHDTQGERLAAAERFRLKGMVVGGKWWPPAGGKR